jgi:hypothetical protein
VGNNGEHVFESCSLDLHLRSRRPDVHKNEDWPRTTFYCDGDPTTTVRRILTYRANGKKCSQFGIYQQLAALVRTIEHSAVMHLPHHQIGDDDGDGGDDKSGACFVMHVRTTTMTMMTLIAMKGTIARLSAYLT